jgi:hypothetical protein
MRQVLARTAESALSEKRIHGALMGSVGVFKSLCFTSHVGIERRHRLTIANHTMKGLHGPEEEAGWRTPVSFF